MSHSALCITNLNHQYKGADRPIFKDLNLKIDAGASFGVFGPNGAGKTTLMSIATGVISYKSGSVMLLGKELGSHKSEILKQIGYVPQSLSMYEELSPMQNLRYFGAMMGLKPSESELRGKSTLEILGLSDEKDNPIKTFSGGMKRRVNLAIGVLHQPKILFLDEPTVGVDVQTRHAILSYLKELNQRGTTLFYTSHLLSEAQELCNEVALIDHGRIIEQGNMAQILSQHGETTLEDLFLKRTGKELRD